MPRKRKELGARIDKMIASLIARGGTGKSIAAALKAKGVTGVSSRTIDRRIREVRGSVAPPRVMVTESLRESYAKAVRDEEASDGGDDSKESTSLPEVGAIPDDVSVEQIEQWIERADKMGRIAYAKGDLQGMGQMGRLTASLMEARRKAKPPDDDDPKDNPDMVKVATEARAKLHKYIDQALGK